MNFSVAPRDASRRRGARRRGAAAAPAAYCTQRTAADWLKLPAHDALRRAVQMVGGAPRAAFGVPLLMASLLLLSPAGGAVSVAPAPTLTIAPGVELPQVVLGTGSGQKGNVSAATALWLSGTAGVGIDTAFEYHDEPAVAAGIAASGKPRGSVFLETKIPCTTYAVAKTNIAQNLVDLKMEAVDLTLIHTTSSWGPGKCDLPGTWRALEEALAAGHSRSIGVSHFKQEHFEELRAAGATVVPAVNQAELSVVFHDDTTIAYCKAHGITYQSYSPLCGGANGSSCTWSGGKNVMAVPEVIAVAKSHGVSAAQVGLKWIVQQGLPLATAVWRLDYMNEDLDLWSWGNLTSAEMAKLSAVAKPHSV